MADRFTEFSLPDTDLTRKAYDLVFATGTAALAHHSVRTYLWGRALGEARGCTRTPTTTTRRCSWAASCTTSG